MTTLFRYKREILLFALGLIVYGGIAGKRIFEQSSDPHFVYQADAWIHGRLAISPPPTKGDDWAKVLTVETKDLKVHRGRYLRTRSFALSDPWIYSNISDPLHSHPGALRLQRMFQTTRGVLISGKDIQRSVGSTHYMSFPPLPALLMVPQVLARGRSANDVVLSVLLAALTLALFYSTLRKLSELELAGGSPSDHVWLTLALGFGTAFFYAAVPGRVWFSAHVIGVLLATLFIRFTLGARHPFWAGLALACAAVTRTPLAFAFVFFVFEAIRVSASSRDWPKFVRSCVVFALPVVAIAVVAMVLNTHRFDNPFEFGHSYLEVRQQAQIEELGLFSSAYLKRNLTVIFALFPSVQASYPFIKMSGHGMALWLTSPFLICLFLSRRRDALFWTAGLTALIVATPGLFYQNTGWFQFGYRFSLDYTPFLILGLALGQPKPKFLLRAAIALSIAINCFGALTFNRHHQFYDPSSYDTLKP